MGFRLSFLRLFNRKTLRRFHQELGDTRGAQQRRLAEILASESEAGYLAGKGVTPTSSPDAYRSRLPVVDYDDLWPYIEPLVREGNATTAPTVTSQTVSMFLKTSGTTGRPKLLPVTPGYEASTDRGRRIWIERMLTEDERNALGAHLTIVSPAHEDHTAGGLPVGANTGRIWIRQPEFLRAFSAIPYETCGLTDFDLRYWAILRLALQRPEVGTFTTANPSTVLLICQRIMEWGPALAAAIENGSFGREFEGTPMAPTWNTEATRKALTRSLRPNPARAQALRDAIEEGEDGLLKRIWPDLTTVNCWQGGHAPIYLHRLGTYLRGIPIRDPGFSASEGLFGIPLRSGTAEGVLHNSGPFMEFVPEGEGLDRTLLSHELEVGKRYQLIATTAGGLWRYNMKDLIEVTDFLESTPLVRFLSKAGGTLSVTGEKVTVEHAVGAAAAVVEEFGVDNLCATVEFSDPPRYVVAVEGEGDRAKIAAAWDACMSRLNIEYREKRASGRLGPPRVELVPPGAFHAWRRRRVEAGAPDGQVKLPPLLPNLDAMTSGPLWGHIK